MSFLLTAMSNIEKAYEEIFSRQKLIERLVKLDESKLVKKLQSMSVDVYINRYGHIIWEGKEIDYYELIAEVEKFVEDLPQEEVEQNSN
jgi:biopolymer transport protein ExbD